MDMFQSIFLGIIAGLALSILIFVVDINERIRNIDINSHCVEVVEKEGE